MKNAEIFDYASEPRVSRTRCPACLAPSQRAFANQDRYGYRITMAGCHCGLGYLSDVMTREGYQRFYSGDPSPYRQLVWAYMEHTPYDRQVANHRLAAIQRTYGMGLKTWLTSVTGVTPARVLDAGGSTGLVARYACPPGTSITVLDPAPAELIRARGMTQIRGFVEDRLPAGIEPFDLILFCETIDHVVDPIAALQNLEAVLKPDGLLYVDYAWAPMPKIDHPLYFEERSFLALLDRVGLHVAARKTGTNHCGALCVKRR